MLPTDRGLKGRVKTELCRGVQAMIFKASWGWIVSAVGVSVINSSQAALCQIQEVPKESWGKHELDKSPSSLIPFICPLEARWRDTAAGKVGNRHTQSPNPGMLVKNSFPCSLRPIVPGSAAHRAWPALPNLKAIKMTVKIWAVKTALRSLARFGLCKSGCGLQVGKYHAER